MSKNRKITLEWWENGVPKQRTADVLIYQLEGGHWGIEDRAIRLLLAKEGGSAVLKAFLPREPKRNRWEERRLARTRWLKNVGLVAVGAWLGVLLT